MYLYIDELSLEITEEDLNSKAFVNLGFLFFGHMKSYLLISFESLSGDNLIFFTDDLLWLELPIFGTDSSFPEDISYNRW